MPKSTNRLRRRIRYEAARIMAEDGVCDFAKAKRKACSRIGVPLTRGIPTNLEIEDGLAEHLSLFSKEKLSEIHDRYLRAAESVMQKLQIYSPRLTGAALSGTITDSRPIALQVFSDTVEDVSSQLSGANIKHRIFDKRMRFFKEGYLRVPAFEFWQDEIEFEVSVFLPGQPYPPLSRIDKKPIKWISAKRVNRLLHGGTV